MNLNEAKRAISDNIADLQIVRKRNFITVRTRSGALYEVYWDIIECSDDGYVYGNRINGQDGPFRKKQQNGTIRWFDLKNVELVNTDEGETK